MCENENVLMIVMILLIIMWNNESNNVKIILIWKY